MKKILYLIPLLTVLTLTGCKRKDTPTQTGTGTGEGNKVQPVGPEGTKIAEIDLKENHATTATEELLIIEDGGITITVEKNTSTNPCGGYDQMGVFNPLRIYSGQMVTISYSSPFNELVFDCGYREDYPFSEYMKETLETNNENVTATLVGKYTLIVKLSSETTEFTYVNERVNDGFKQNRIYKVELYR